MRRSSDINAQAISVVRQGSSDRGCAQSALGRSCLYTTRDDAARLAAPAAAGPAHRARSTAEGIASLAPDDAGLQHGRARVAGPDARAETRRPRRPTEDIMKAG